MHGGLKIYRGSAAAARNYVEADRSRADDYYLAEGSGVAQRLVAGPSLVQRRGDMDGPTYERWVAGYDVGTGAAKGRRSASQQCGRCLRGCQGYGGRGGPGGCRRRAR